MKRKPNALKLTGYRLPTEVEWEYAGRAGADTTWSFGNAEDLVEHYAWYDRNSYGRTHPVGTLKPNDLGLFDMQGNAWEWCQDRDEKSVEGAAAKEKDRSEAIDNKQSRLSRGSAYHNHAVDVSPATRSPIMPAYRFNNVGFRPARTMPAE